MDNEFSEAFSQFDANESLRPNYGAQIAGVGDHQTTSTTVSAEMIDYQTEESSTIGDAVNGTEYREILKGEEVSDDDEWARPIFV